MTARTSTQADVLLLGFGQVADAVFRILPDGGRVYATTRQPMRLFELAQLQLEPIIMPLPLAELVEPLASGNDVLVSFPPDGKTDAILAPACRHARSIVYISSTSVYGSYRGEVDDTTVVASDDETVRRRLDAEQSWRDVGATVLRAPGIYGPTSGLHIRMQKGTYAIPGDGSGISSRIHVEDLARLVVAAWKSESGKQTFVVGDLNPASHVEVASWLSRRLNVAQPAFAPLESVHATFAASRAINPKRALEQLGVQLKYPDYTSGYEALLEAMNGRNC